MQLKQYQKEALGTLETYLKELTKDGPKKAFNNVTPEDRPKYKDSAFDKVPFVCIKIPTGGGKTVVAAHAVEKILDIALQDKLERGIVLWFTPTDAIQTQTLGKLRDRKDWHRRILDEAFNNNVKIFSNQEALAITTGDVSDNLCIIVASIDAFRKEKTIRNKYKVYQENGALLEHFRNIEEEDYLERDSEGTVINSLANVICLSNPLILIDEGHHTQTTLSFDVLKSLNPSFVIEFTATPRNESNILVDVSASELKAEQMVKIPIVLESAGHWHNAIEDGIAQRLELEKAAKKLKGEYIRPIALLQAQSDRDTASVTINVIKKFLLDKGIPEDEIAIKVSGKNELEGKNLFSKDCKIKYIITVNALAEGWDCSFAYVLISVANLGAPIQVEQIIGRIMRMPGGKKKQINELNQSYVFASAKSFQEAADLVIKSLKNHGYASSDVVSANKKDEVDELKVDKAIKSDLKVPHIAFAKEKMAWEDLLEDFELAKQNHVFVFDASHDSDGKVVIDLDKEGEWSKGRQMKLNLQYQDKNFSKKELVQWLDKKSQFSVLEQTDKIKFLEKAIDHLLKKHSLTELSVNRFVLLGKVKEVIAQLLETHVEKSFNQKLKGKKITTQPFNSFPAAVFLKKPVKEEFNKSLYKKIDLINKEEHAFAQRLDLLPNIKFWVRNQEKMEWFYIQGWKKGKFYPDFVAVTKKGNTIVLEWKGEMLVGGPDTDYKEEIGNLWAKLGKGKLHFALVTNKNVEKVLSEIKNL